ncbi:hypothetical protein TIFTF001_032631 [Ficus carica]|uniref:CCHC-type domain-containing protein n=1 Tax=Ficus carica TaxID=3494 RepID=A0AA88J854_FICCA|nr:hypothetical protein TIFTF001_032631 [Ficus carica]
MYYNAEILAAQQDEFTSLQQGSMTVMEAVQKFEQLARLCPELVPTEKEKVRRMMKMFRTDISKQVSAGSSPPTLIFKARKEEKAVVKQTQPRQSSESNQKGQTSSPAQNSKQFGRNKRKGNFSGQGQQKNFPPKRNNRGIEGSNTDFPQCAKCGKKHPGVCRMGTNACYLCGKEGHFARNCNQNLQNQNPPRPSRNARIFAYTRGDAEAGTSHVVTGQISITTSDAIATYDAIALFDSGATHSFISLEFAQKLGRVVDSPQHRLSTVSYQVLPVGSLPTA